MKYILFLCGGKWQLPWLKKIKSKGHSVILVDPNDNPICKEYADLYFQCDVLDVDKILKFIYENNYEIESVTSEQTDVATIPASILAEKLNVKYHSLDTVNKFTNKYISRKYIEKLDNSHIPKYQKCNSVKQLQHFLEDNFFRVIIKPANSQSSRGIHLIDKSISKINLEKCFNDAISFGSVDYIVAEEFVKGEEYTVEGIIHENNHEILTLSRKKHFREGIASELNFGVELDYLLMEELLVYHNKLITETGIKFGITHSEYIINLEEKKFWLVEMACRGGGTLIPSHIVPWVTGVDVYEHFYNQFFLNRSIELNRMSVNRNSILHFFEFPEGEVLSIEGLEFCKSIKGVLTLDLEFRVGDFLKNASDDRGRQGFVIVLSNSELESRDVISKIYENLKITYQNAV